MHVLSSFPTSDRSIRWIESLAEQEVSSKNGQQNYDLCSTREEILAVETLNFLNELRYHVEYMVRLFNNCLVDKKGGVKFFLDSSPLRGISLARNTIQFELGSKKPGAIHLNCFRKNSVTQEESVLSTGLVEATFSTFHDLEWIFLGAPVTSEKIARHFLTEFLQISRTH